MPVPSNGDILAALARLDTYAADDLETQWLEFKPWNGSKQDMKVAVEYAVCFANAEGGAVVFGVRDGVRGRSAAIQGAAGYDLDTWRRGIFAATRPNLAVEVEELAVPEGTGRLLVVRVPAGDGTSAYGTAEGLYKRRVGKNCMPLDPPAFLRARVETGAVDWSGRPADGVTTDDIDEMEVARARGILRSKNPESGLLRLKDRELLEGLEAVRGGRVTNAGLLLFGKPDVVARVCPQSQVHYVHQPSATKVSANIVMRGALLDALARIEQIFEGPANPEEELSMGLFKLRVAAFPLDAVREAVLNAVTHRSYADPGEVLIRHGRGELVLTSPGGFVGGITLRNILRHEAVARNRTLANAFVKLRLVEAAGTGRGKIFSTMLSMGKRIPRYETDGGQVTLRLFDGAYDARMARMVAKWNAEGVEVSLESLMVLAHLREHPFIDVDAAAELLQLSRDDAREALERMTMAGAAVLERRGRTRAATFHLSRGVAKDLLGKATYTRTKGLDSARYSEMVRQFVKEHGSITPRECRELLGLGESASASVEVSRYLKRWSGPEGFLRMEGKPPRNRYLEAGGGTTDVNKRRPGAPSEGR